MYVETPRVPHVVPGVVVAIFCRQNMDTGESNVKSGPIVLGNGFAQEDLMKILTAGDHVDINKGGDRKRCLLHGLDLDPLVEMAVIRPRKRVVWILRLERLFADNDQGVKERNGAWILA